MFRKNIILVAAALITYGALLLPTASAQTHVEELMDIQVRLNGLTENTLLIREIHEMDREVATLLRWVIADLSSDVTGLLTASVVFSALDKCDAERQTALEFIRDLQAISIYRADWTLERTSEVQGLAQTQAMKQVIRELEDAALELKRVLS